MFNVIITIIVIIDPYNTSINRTVEDVFWSNRLFCFYSVLLLLSILFYAVSGTVFFFKDGYFYFTVIVTNRKMNNT
jgi:hypothetical protein